MKKIKTPNKVSRQIDLRDVRGQSIPGSSTMRSKKDKAKDPKKLFRGKHMEDYDESYDDELPKNPKKLKKGDKVQVDTGEIGHVVTSYYKVGNPEPLYGIDLDGWKERTGKVFPEHRLTKLRSYDEYVFRLYDIVETPDGEIGMVRQRYDKNDELTYKILFDNNETALYKGNQLKLIKTDDDKHDTMDESKKRRMCKEGMYDNEVGWGEIGRVVAWWPNSEESVPVTLVDIDDDRGTATVCQKGKAGMWDVQLDELTLMPSSANESRARRKRRVNERSIKMSDADSHMWATASDVLLFLKNHNKVETVDFIDDEPIVIQARLKDGPCVYMTFGVE